VPRATRPTPLVDTPGPPAVSGPTAPG